jgi:chromosomal replication initiation ATPase DnaA
MMKLTYEQFCGKRDLSHETESETIEDYVRYRIAYRPGQNGNLDPEIEAQALFTQFCAVRNLNPALITTKFRNRNLVHERQMYCHFMRDQHTFIPLKYIGWVLNQDHASVIHGAKNFKNLTETYPRYFAEYLELKEKMELLNTNLNDNR